MNRLNRVFCYICVYNKHFVLYLLKDMNIRKTRLEDLAVVMKIYDYAKVFMREHGNGNQWVDGYPSDEFIAEEIRDGHSYVCEDEHGEMIGTFCYIPGPDPTYQHIYKGEWLNDEPYGVIHRMASNGAQKGIATVCLAWSFQQCKNIRVDTHHDNVVMQNLLQKHGFAACGIIYVKNGTERIAYHKVVQ